MSLNKTGSSESFNTSIFPVKESTSANKYASTNFPMG